MTILHNPDLRHLLDEVEPTTAQQYHPPDYLKVMCGPTDHLPPDVRAMQQAAYSRSTKSIMDRMAETPADMDKARAGLREYYVGWNHKSVGQLGETTLWFEGISQIAAKAIEDTQLFNGQECSTRYIDFTHQPFIDFGNAEIALWQVRWKALYMKALPLTIAELKIQFPFETPVFSDDEVLKARAALALATKADLDEITHAMAHAELYKKATKTWENTIKARAFDICRSLITCGATTNVSFSSTFDTLNDQLGQLLYHPSPEVSHLAYEAIAQMQAKYPDSTPGVKKLLERNAHVTSEYFYQPTWSFWEEQPDGSYNQPQPGLQVVGGKITDDMLDLLPVRKIYQRLPRHVSTAVRLKMIDELDFGSFRDLHRHRPGTCLMPMVMPLLGFHQWYLDELPPLVAEEAAALLKEQSQTFRERLITGEDAVQLQYCLPMGLKVPVSYECDLNQFLYILERRSDKTVHQTLRQMVHRQAGCFDQLVLSAINELKGDGAEQEKRFFAFASFVNEGSALAGVHVDGSKDNWTLKRGQQTVNEPPTK